jgi:hypothetical protein
MLIQYWREIDDLLEFARRPASTHLAAQKRLWRHYAAAGGAVGVWHEILPVPEIAYGCLYGNMPPTGIGALRGLRPRPGRWAHPQPPDQDGQGIAQAARSDEPARLQRFFSRELRICSH